MNGKSVVQNMPTYGIVRPNISGDEKRKLILLATPGFMGKHLQAKCAMIV